MSAHSGIQIGLNYRDFPENWRPALDEIAFASNHGFQAIQFHGQPAGLTADHLGAPLADVGAALRTAGLLPTMELLLRVTPAGSTASGQTPLAIFQANLPAITALGCRAVHWHLAPLAPDPAADWQALETAVLPQLAAAVALANTHGFRFGLEHNEPGTPIFPTPARCLAALQAVPGLSLLWDLNHTPPDQLADYLALAPQMLGLHVADTPLPAVNHHLPLGLGSIDFPHIFATLHANGFRGPAILEIGGQPASGGFGRDTDAALLDSLRRCQIALRNLSGWETKGPLENS